MAATATTPTGHFFEIFSGQVFDVDAVVEAFELFVLTHFSLLFGVLGRRVVVLKGRLTFSPGYLHLGHAPRWKIT